MEEKLFKAALEFIEKYEITSYSISIYPHPQCVGSKIVIQGLAFENYKAMLELDVKNNKNHRWYNITENGIDLTLTYD
jgi:hypothetical protein